MKLFRKSPSKLWVHFDPTKALLSDLRASGRCASLYTAFLKDLRRQTSECTGQGLQREKDECLNQLWRYKVQVFKHTLQSKNYSC